MIARGIRLAHRCPGGFDVNVRFVSSLTAADEEGVAPVVLKVVGALLGHLPLAYTIRIETSSGTVFQHTHPAVPDTSRAAAAPTPKPAGDTLVSAFNRITAGPRKSRIRAPRKES